MVLFKYNMPKAIDLSTAFTFHYGPIQILKLTVTCIDPLIYIPLWSYSNLVRLVRRRRSPSIYIPLWSYSNMIFLKIFEVILKFTFHYGPIQML